uniref:YadA-like family protein n=1 Tax=Parerythrobacter aestuarii TaxID=3020909 RepID=UPI0024DE2708
GATAVGREANAGFDNSTAIGYQATTTAANQVTLGGTGSSVRIGDVAASTAAQSGPVEAVTVDGNGVLGTTAVASAAAVRDVQAGLGYLAAVSDQQFSALSGRVSGLENGFANVNFRLDELDESTSGGIAAAMAFGGTMIVPESNVSVSVNASTYQGEQGFAGTVTARVAPKVYVSAGVAGSTARNSTGGRVGVAFGF